MFSKPTAIINLDHLQHNVRVAKQFAPNSKLLAVVKANAYGHGCPEIVNALTEADAFAVARFDEALDVRLSEKTKPVLILGGVYTNNELDSCLQHTIDIVVHQHEQVELLSKHRSVRDTRITIWLKVDTGMHRLGIAPERFCETYKKLSQLPFVKSVVAMTHFANAEQAGNPHTQSQISVFNNALSSLGKSTVESSLANSAALLNWPETRRDWVRPGLMLYGINPLAGKAVDLKPVMTLQAPIVSLRTISANEYVGYSLVWQARRKSKIATVALGYGDGYPTQLKPGTPVLVNGKRLSIIGRVSMDMITLDCTDHDDIKTGDKVIFWGEDVAGNRLAVEEIAAQANTIPYDLVTKISGRVKYSY